MSILTLNCSALTASSAYVARWAYEACFPCLLSHSVYPSYTYCTGPYGRSSGYRTEHNPSLLVDGSDQVEAPWVLLLDGYIQDASQPKYVNFKIENNIEDFSSFVLRILK